MSIIASIKSFLTPTAAPLPSDAGVGYDVLALVALRTDNIVVITDAQGYCEWVNDSFYNLTGYTLEEVRGKKPGHLLQGPDTDPATVARIREKVLMGQPVQEEILNYTKGGRPYWLYITITPIRNEKGEVVKFVAIETDLTQRIENEQHQEALLEEIRSSNEELLALQEENNRVAALLRDQNDQLKYNEGRLKLLSMVASKTDNAVIITDRNGGIEWVNPGFTKISGYTLDEVKGRKPGHILQGPDTDPATVQRIREQLGSRQSFREEILNYNKNGTPYWLSLSITPVLDLFGEVEKFIAIELDITERKETELHLRKTEQDMRDSIAYAQRIQRAILPSHKLFERRYVNSFVYLKPKDMLSGDFLWHWENDAYVYIAAGDCTGHGVPGSLISILGSNLLGEVITRQPGLTPAQVLDQMTEAFQHTMDDEEHHNYDSIELALIRWDKHKKQLHFAGANRPLAIVQNGEVTELTGSKRAVGVDQLRIDDPFRDEEVPVTPDTYVYLYSDGANDQMNPEGIRFSKRRLLDLLKSLGTKDPDAQKRLLERELRFWRGTADQTDDIIVVGAKLW